MGDDKLTESVATTQLAYKRCVESLVTADDFERILVPEIGAIGELPAPPHVCNVYSLLMDDVDGIRRFMRESESKLYAVGPCIDDLCAALDGGDDIGGCAHRLLSAHNEFLDAYGSSMQLITGFHNELNVSTVRDGCPDLYRDGNEFFERYRRWFYAAGDCCRAITDFAEASIRQAQS